MGLVVSSFKAGKDQWNFTASKRTATTDMPQMDWLVILLNPIFSPR